MRTTNIAGYYVAVGDVLGVVGTSPDFERSTGTLYKADILHAGRIGCIVGIAFYIAYHDRLYALAILFHDVELVRIKDCGTGEEECFNII